MSLSWFPYGDEASIRMEFYRLPYPRHYFLVLPVIGFIRKTLFQTFEGNDREKFQTHTTCCSTRTGLFSVHVSESFLLLYAVHFIVP